MKWLEAKAMREDRAQQAPAAETETQTEPETPAGTDATDAARRLADEHGVDLATVSGTGSGGRITVGDVESAIEQG